MARILTERRDELAGELRFIFQHAEEVPARRSLVMVDAGVMDGVDLVVQHVATLEHGQIGVEGRADDGLAGHLSSSRSAASGGHAAASEQRSIRSRWRPVVMALQTIVRAPSIRSSPPS
ncbi:MAG: hypothetical protein R2882_14630 [Gemmatimonadales bacterium]